MERDEYDQFADWLEDGVLRGWVSYERCMAHDIIPLTQEEEETVAESGNIPCINVLRVFIN